MINGKKIFPIVAAIAAAVVMVSVHTGTAMAQSSCKGIAKGKCESSASCSWVNSYKTKSGTTVNAYCRANGSKGAAKTSDKSKAKAGTKAKSKSVSATDKAKKKTSVKKKSTAKKMTDTKKKAAKSAKTVSRSADTKTKSKITKPTTGQK